MTKFEALKMLPLERFADLFYRTCQRANDADEFKKILEEEFPEDVIPALQKCSTGEDLVNTYGVEADNSSSHHYGLP